MADLLGVLAVLTEIIKYRPNFSGGIFSYDYWVDSPAPPPPTLDYDALSLTIVVKLLWFSLSKGWRAKDNDWVGVYGTQRGNKIIALRLVTSQVFTMLLDICMPLYVVY